MSLINNALKKAQRQRSEGAASAPTPGRASHRPSRHSKAMPAQSLLLIIIGACVVVALSVALTVYFLRTPNSAELPPPVTAKTTTQPAQTTATPQVTNTPIETMPTLKVEAPTRSEPEPVIEKQVKPAPAVIVVQPPEPAPPPEPVVRPEVKIYAFIDKIQVMGVRFSGASSKVLMNDHVYRVNDIVDRTLGLRLIKVTPNSLTFVDPNGASYIKNF